MNAARRRRWLPALVLLATLAGCGDDYDLPALAASDPPRIRVLLGGRRRTEAVLKLVGRQWEVTSEGGGPFVRRDRTEVNARIHAGPNGIAIGREDTGARVLRVRTDGGFELEGIHYAGDLILHREDGRIRFVNELDLETYVAGVIPNEMAPQATPAAYRAQAVAARSYGWRKLTEAGAAERKWHVTDDQGSQVYTGLDPRYNVAYAGMVEHTARTAGVILTWQNRPFPAYYSSTCGGHTTDAKTSRLNDGGAGVPLRGVRCEFCSGSPRYAWTKRVKSTDVIAGMKARGRPISAPVHAIQVTTKGPGGWAAEVSITHGANRTVKKVPGPDFRSALRLDSHFILGIDKREGGWLLRGRGWGHGVGMCQWGAMEMAKRGSTESEILSWYYPGAAFTRVY